jgi:hypothetical protein
MTATDDTSDTTQNTGTDEQQRDAVPGSAPQATGSAPNIEPDIAGIGTPGVDGKSGISADTADEFEQESDASE